MTIPSLFAPKPPKLTVILPPPDPPKGGLENIVNP